MNVVGAFMWVSVGATALHYWQGYMADHDHQSVVRERTVSINCQLPLHLLTIDVCRTDKNANRNEFDFRLVWCWDRCVCYKVHCTSWIQS